MKTEKDVVQTKLNQAKARFLEVQAALEKLDGLIAERTYLRGRIDKLTKMLAEM